MTKPTPDKYYRPTNGARIRNPVTNDLVPSYGQLVRSHFFLWAKRVRTGEAEEIKDEKTFLAGRSKVLDAARKASDAASTAESDENKGDKSSDAEKKGNKWEN